MSEIERNKRLGKSAMIVERIVRAQLRAMGCDRFDLGILPDADETMLRERQRAVDIEKVIKWLRRENARGAQSTSGPPACTASASSMILASMLSIE